MPQASAIVVGVGPPRGLGAAIARRFAKEGFRTTIVGRSEDKVQATLRELLAGGATAAAVVGDVTDETLVRRVVSAADLPQAPLSVAVFNAGGNWPAAFCDMDAAFLEQMWRTNALAGFFFAKAAIQSMLPRRDGTLIFTGASASLRGKARFGGFAQAKAALRALAQSAAREFGPQGIHVAHVIVDGAIDGDRINTFLPNLKAERGDDGLLDPDAIAENYWQIHRQARSAWTHELDLRPWRRALVAESAEPRQLKYPLVARLLLGNVRLRSSAPCLPRAVSLPSTTQSRASWEEFPSNIVVDVDG